MGTRADFYIKKAEDTELLWIASIAWDGYPDGIDAEVLSAKNQTDYIAALQKFLSTRRDVTLPADGWPWPWDDSRTTDFAYCFVDGRVLTNHFGNGWHVFVDGEDNDDAEIVWNHDFPDMKDVKNVRYDEGSGLIVLTIPH